MLDVDGKVIRGYSRVRLRTDRRRRAESAAIHWKDGRDLTPLADRTVRFRFPAHRRGVVLVLDRDAVMLSKRRLVVGPPTAKPSAWKQSLRLDRHHVIRLIVYVIVIVKWRFRYSFGMCVIK